MLRNLLRSTLFPYTTLFRSVLSMHAAESGLERLLLSKLRVQVADLIGVSRVLDVVLSSADRECVRDVVLDAIRCGRSEEHTSELQSQIHLVCRRLLEKKSRS